MNDPFTHELGLLPDTLKYTRAVHALTTDYTSHLRNQPLRASSCLVVMVTDGRTDEISKSTYFVLQNPCFFEKRPFVTLHYSDFYVNGK